MCILSLVLSAFSVRALLHSLRKRRRKDLTANSDWKKMKKGVHPQMQWISYVTQSGRLIQVMMTKIHPVGKVYHFRAKRQMAESLGQIAKFRRRFGQQNENINPK